MNILEVRTRVIRYKFWDFISKNRFTKWTWLGRKARRKLVWLFWLISSKIEPREDDFEEVIL